MAEGGFDPFEGKTVDLDNTTDETFPLHPRVNTVDNHELNTSDVHETSFGGTGQSLRVRKIFVEDLYKKLSKDFKVEIPKTIRTDLFEIDGGELYYKDNNKPLTKNGKFRAIKTIKEFLGKDRMREMGFNIPADSKVSARDATVLNEKYNELQSASQSVDNANDIELETIADSVQSSIEDLIHISKEIQTDGLFELPIRELLSLDREARTRSGHIKTLTTKMTTINEEIKEQQDKLDYIQNSTEYNEEEKQPLMERIKDRITNYEEIRDGYQKNIDDLKYELKSQITNIKETISKVLDSDTTLGEKIRTLFREQGITIASILTAFGMAIGVLVEALLPGGGGASATSSSNTTGGDSSDKSNAKEWIKDKLKALASLLGKLASKAAAALPGIIGSIISWILNRAKEVVGWLSQNLWALIVGIGGLIYTYLVTRR